MNCVHIRPLPDLHSACRARRTKHSSRFLILTFQLANFWKQLQLPYFHGELIMLSFITKCPCHAATASIHYFNFVATRTQEFNGGVRSTWQAVCCRSLGALMAMWMKYYFGCRKLFPIIRQSLLIDYAQTLKLFRAQKELIQQPYSFNSLPDFIFTPGEQVQIVMFECINFRRLDPYDRCFHGGVDIFQQIKYSRRMMPRLVNKPLGQKGSSCPKNRQHLNLKSITRQNFKRGLFGLWLNITRKRI